MHRRRQEYHVVGSIAHRLEEAWEIKGEYLTGHDGDPKDWMKTTKNIKGDPLLREAIFEIRDGYFELFYEMQQARNQWKAVSWKSYVKGDEKSQEAKRALDKVDRDLIIHNRDSLERLQLKDYGFNAAEKAEIIERADQYVLDDCGEALSKREAYGIVGKTIGRSIDAFEVISGPRNRIDVPDSFDPVNKDYRLKKRERLHPAESKIRASYPLLFKSVDTPALSGEALEHLVDQLEDTRYNPGYAAIAKVRDGAQGSKPLVKATEAAHHNFVKALFDTMSTPPGELRNLRMREFKELRSELASLYIDNAIAAGDNSINRDTKHDALLSLLEGTITATVFNAMKSMELLPEDTKPGKLYEGMRKGRGLGA